MLNLTEKDRCLIRKALNEHLPGVEVWAYGSRVNGTSHLGSDLDLVILGKERISVHTLTKLNDALEESNLTFTVDLHDWQTIPDDFKKVIETQHEILQKRL